jgi:hypothetical protein
VAKLDWKISKSTVREIVFNKPVILLNHD